MKIRLSFAALALLLAGCDVPGLGPGARVVQREADGKAIGAACRHALRGIEDCYGLNEKAAKTSIFEGWKEMDQYMRDNKIEGIAPVGIRPAAPAEEIITEPKGDKRTEDTAKPKTKANEKPDKASAAK